MGSKNRHAKEILPIILKDRQPNQYYVEPFCGGCNMIDKVGGYRIANDYHYYLIEMWKALQDGWIPPDYVDKESHRLIRINKETYDPHTVGWVGFNCSYSGVYFGGFAGITKTKVGGIRNYQSEAKRNVLSQIKKLEGVIFCNTDYIDLQIPDSSIIYCDPPYENTSGYKVASSFDHDTFWEWCRFMTGMGHSVFISEYNAPEDFECIWEKEVKSSLSANGISGGNKNSIEKLFKYKG